MTMMHSITSSLVVPTGAWAVTAAAIETKPVMSPPFNMGAAAPDLIADLLTHAASSQSWASGFIPLAFYTEARNNGLNPSDFEVRNVQYSDCGSPWAMCRHKSATVSWDSLMKTIGQIPVGMRQYLANIAIFPNVNNICAYTVGSYTIFSQGCFDIGVASHEFTHVLDGTALEGVVTGSGYPAGTPYSETTHFSGAYSKDSATPTQYAHDSVQASGNLVEDFADTGRLAMSDMTHAGGLAAYTSGSSQIANQLGNYKARLQSIIFPSGGRCTGKVDTTKAVSMTTGMKARWASDAVARSPAEDDRVPEIKVSEAAANIRFPPYQAYGAMA